MKKQSVFFLVLTALFCLAVNAGSPHGEAATSPAFEKFKGLAGQWQGVNGKGDKVTASYEVVSNGSAVLERLIAEGHGDMVTLIHHNGEQVMLTHYCGAGNQPRMKATAIEDREIGFSFIDATNLASEDAGHMGAVVFKFKDANHLTSEWTWREKGKDPHIEVITLERVKDKTESP